MASFIPFFDYLFDNNRVKSSGLVWVRSPNFGARASGLVSRRGDAQFGSRGFSENLESRIPSSRLLDFPVSIFEFPNSVIGKKNE